MAKKKASATAAATARKKKTSKKKAATKKKVQPKNASSPKGARNNAKVTAKTNTGKDGPGCKVLTDENPNIGKPSTPRSGKKRPAKKSRAALKISFGMLITELPDDSTLFLMPIARPSNAQMRSSLEEDLRSVCGDNYLNLGGPISSVISADAQGRVLWGWSPWRAKQHCLSWSQWDQFCRRWLELDPRQDTRPDETYGVDKSTSVDALALEVEALVSKKRLKLISNYPFGFKKK